MLLIECLMRLGVFFVYTGALWNMSSFMTACLTDNVENMKKFGKSLVSLQFTTKEGITPLHAVVIGWKPVVGGPYNGHRAAFKELITMMEAFCMKIDSQISKRSQMSTFRMMLNKKAGPDQVSAISLAILAGHFPIVFLLQEKGAMTDQPEMKLFMRASITTLDEHYGVLEVIDPNFRGNRGRVVPGMKIAIKESHHGQEFTVIKAIDSSSANQKFLVHIKNSVVEPFQVENVEMVGTVSPANRLELISLAFEHAMMKKENCDFLWGRVSPTILYTVMRALPRDKNVAETGSRVIMKMIKAAIEEGKTSNDEVFTASNVEQYIRTLSNAVHLHPYNSLTAQYALEAIASLSQYEHTKEVALKTARAKGVINVAFDAMRLHYKGVELSKNTAMIVHTLLETCSTSSHDQIDNMEHDALKNGAINFLFDNLLWNTKNDTANVPLIMSILRLTDTVVLFNLTDYAYNKSEKSMHTLFSMLSYRTELAFFIISVMSNIVKMSKDMFKKVLSENRLGEIELLVRILGTSTDQEVCKMIMVLLSTIITPKIAKKAIASGLFPALERSMITYNLYEDVKILVLNLAKLCHESREIVISSGIIEVLTANGIEMILPPVDERPVANADAFAQVVENTPYIFSAGGEAGAGASASASGGGSAPPPLRLAKPPSSNDLAQDELDQARKNASTFQLFYLAEELSELPWMLKNLKETVITDLETKMSRIEHQLKHHMTKKARKSTMIVLKLFMKQLKEAQDLVLFYEAEMKRIPNLLASMEKENNFEAETPMTPSILDLGYENYEKARAPTSVRPTRSLYWPEEVVADVRTFESEPKVKVANDDEW